MDFKFKNATKYVNRDFHLNGHQTNYVFNLTRNITLKLIGVRVKCVWVLVSISISMKLNGVWMHRQSSRKQKHISKNIHTHIIQILFRCKYSHASNHLLMFTHYHTHWKWKLSIFNQDFFYNFFFTTYVHFYSIMFKSVNNAKPFTIDSWSYIVSIQTNNFNQTWSVWPYQFIEKICKRF